MSKPKIKATKVDPKDVPDHILEQLNDLDKEGKPAVVWIDDPEDDPWNKKKLH